MIVNIIATALISGLFCYIAGIRTGVILHKKSQIPDVVDWHPSSEFHYHPRQVGKLP